MIQEIEDKIGMLRPIKAIFKLSANKSSWRGTTEINVDIADKHQPALEKMVAEKDFIVEQILKAANSHLKFRAATSEYEVDTSQLEHSIISKAIGGLIDFVEQRSSNKRPRQSQVHKWLRERHYMNDSIKRALFNTFMYYIREVKNSGPGDQPKHIKNIFAILDFLMKKSNRR